VWAPAAPGIAAPASYSWTRSSSVTFTGSAEAGSTVELFDDATSLGTTVTSASGAWSRQVTLSEGAHVISAKASNLGGTSPASAIRVIQVDTRAPASPVFASPAAGSTVAATFTLSGTAESGTTLELFEDGVSRGTIAAVGGTWSRQMSGVGSATHNYTARTTDIAGNTSPLSSAWTVRVGT
jgi:hypothetical protein